VPSISPTVGRDPRGIGAVPQVAPYSLNPGRHPRHEYTHSSTFPYHSLTSGQSRELVVTEWSGRLKSGQKYSSHDLHYSLGWSPTGQFGRHTPFMNSLTPQHSPPHRPGQGRELSPVVGIRARGNEPQGQASLPSEITVSTQPLNVSPPFPGNPRPTVFPGRDRPLIFS
jgi:hypothetical protein